ncbi:MAG: lytic transglycosylase domain-containing protein [Burkholderiaceae bacterium]|nr:MAG: lytic transglycosylase domain-containing protein [Burkholderiaceae bacterium]
MPWSLRVRLAIFLFVLGGFLPSVQADEVWEFVDADGVVHIGNAAPPASRGLIWLSQTPSARGSGGKGKEREVSALRLPGYEAAKPHLEAAALSQSLEPALVIAVAAAESAFNVEAVSRKGALGLMQVMPATAERYGVAGRTLPDGKHAAMEPKVNAQIGSRYLADLLRMFDGDKELALAAYNAGEGAVLRYGRRIPPYPETQQYVDRVMRFYRALVR